VHAVRADRQRDVDPIVDVERDARRRRYLPKGAPQLGQLAPGKVLLAQLHRDLVGRQAADRHAPQGGGDDVGQRAASRRVAVGDQVEAGRLTQ